MSRIITVSDLIELAKQHGEDSEPDHEVGDLQSMFRVAASIMTPPQLEKFIKVPEIQDVLDGMMVDDPENIGLVHD